MIVALAGGVGGARLALGLSLALPPGALTVIVNTADDFEHMGLEISPDLDTVMYTLAGLDNPETGWGQREETWSFMAATARLGGETWFRLGDRDLATHIERTRRRRAGETLSEVTSAMSRALGIASAIVPMSDERVRTFVETDQGVLAFQEYFVRRRCEPRVRGLRFDGAASARPAAGVIEALSNPKLQAIVICPSNPYVSIDPILAVPGLRHALENRRAPLVAVSPIVGGKAIKGPAAKMMAELGADVSALGIAKHYRGLIDGLVIDDADLAHAPDIVRLGILPHVTDTIMSELAKKRHLAAEALALAVDVDWTRGVVRP